MGKVFLIIGLVFSLISCKKDEPAPSSNNNTSSNNNSNNQNCLSETDGYYVKAKVNGELKEYPTKKGLTIYTDAIDKEVINIMSNETLTFGNTELPGFVLWIECGYPPVTGIYDASFSSSNSFVEYFYYYEDGNYDCWNYFTNCDSTACQIEISSVIEDCDNYILEGTFSGYFQGNEDTTITNVSLTEGEFKVIL